MGCSQSSQQQSGDGTIGHQQKKKVSIATGVTICLPEECESSKETPSSCGSSDCDKGFSPVEKFSLMRLDEEPVSPAEQKKPRRNRRRRSAELIQSANSPKGGSPRGTLTNPLGTGSWHGVGAPDTSLRRSGSNSHGQGGAAANISPSSQSLSATTCTATNSHTTTAGQSMSLNPLTASGELSSHSVLGLIAGSAAGGEDAGTSDHPIPGVTALNALPAFNNSNSGSNNLSSSTAPYLGGSSSINSSSVSANFPQNFSASMSTNCPPRKNSASILGGGGRLSVVSQHQAQLPAGAVSTPMAPKTPKSPQTAAVVVTTQVVNSDDLMTQRSQDWAKAHIDTEFNKSSFCVKSPVEAGINSPLDGRNLQQQRSAPLKQGLGSPVVVASGVPGQAGFDEMIEAAIGDATSPLLGRSVMSDVLTDDGDIVSEAASQDCSAFAPIVR